MTVIWCIVALICAGFGVASVIIPEDMIYMREFSRFRNFEPTERYIRLERIKGISLVIVAVIILICVFI